mmetsp:Transcript_37200/g.55438  ORF Transcript_37200/g.55438 Transcript_37200/m.55438 type:complete len:95 (+) Transcript_37200:951-1235(+)
MLGGERKSSNVGLREAKREAMERRHRKELHRVKNEAEHARRAVANEYRSGESSRVESAVWWKVVNRTQHFERNKEARKRQMDWRFSSKGIVEAQ